MNVSQMIPAPVQAEIRAAYAHDPNNWFRHPSMRLFRMAMQRVLASRGIKGEVIPLVEQALHLH